ncbi:non-specific lipid-transfer protein 2-like [Aristolochia californica]|uniref:non-specific lipid-transfer protein 2-like n=1 Tax=Aristolochia californica TaxID=171875 RepID=UPI0035DB8A63
MKLSHLAVSVMVALLLAGEAQVSVSLVCNAMELSPCAAAIFSAVPPSGACCGKLSQQKPCLCKYLRDPNLRKYINSGNAKRVADACRVPFPKC